MASKSSVQNALLPLRKTSMVGMRWYFAFFLTSGFCSLVYEVVWLRLAMAQFGVTTPMISIVLSMFMAGLGLGCWGAGRFVRRFQDSAAATPLRFYALTELFIGISGLVMPHILAYGHDLLLKAAEGVAWQSAVYYVLSGGWVAVSLIPSSFCMGATFPLAMAAIKKKFGAEAQRSFSYLYLANVVGAVLGTIMSAFLLIEMLGFRGTLQLTSAVNGILAGCVFLLSLSPDFSLRPMATSPEPDTNRETYEFPKKTLLVLLFATGLISMGMEVVWIRQFTPYLGNVVYAFALILAVYLVATFSGSTAYRSWIRSHDPRESDFAWTLAGLLGLIPLLAADPRIPIPVGQHQAGFLLGTIRVVIGIGAFSALLGFLTPMLVDLWSAGDPDRAGSAYAVNVVGSIVGPLVAGFCLLPWMSPSWALCVLAVPLFLLGLLAEFRPRLAHPKSYRKSHAKIRYGVALLLSVFLAVFTNDYEKHFNGVVRRDYTAAVVATGTGMRKNLVVNGISMTILTPITKIMSHLPLALLDHPPEKGLVVCFGMGTTFRSMLSWGIHTTAVDLIPSVPAVFGYFHADGPELVKSRLARIVTDDGRRFLEGSTEQYDVITLDPPPPVGAPTSSLLYSREFDEIANKHLKPDGILQVWLPGGDAATKASVAHALQDCFPHVRVFRSIEAHTDLSGGLHFLASKEPVSITSGAVLAAHLPPAAARDLVEWGPASTAEDMFNSVLSGEVPLERIIAIAPRVPALSDDQPINEYFFLRWDFRYYR